MRKGELLRFLRTALQSRKRTLLIGYGTAIALVVAVAIFVQLLPREVSDDLYNLYSYVVLAAVVLMITATISALFRNRSLKFLLALLFGSLLAALSLLPVYLGEKNMPVVFSPGIITPLGVVVSTGTALVIIGRLWANRDSQK